MMKKLKYWAPVAAWMAFIFWMSTETFSSANTSLIIGPVLRFLVEGISSDTLESIHGALRKLGHLAEYFILGFLLFRAFRRSSAISGALRLAFPALFVLVLYAASDEFHQSFVATRTASGRDVLIDTAGGVFGQMANAFWALKTRAKKARSDS